MDPYRVKTDVVDTEKLSLILQTRIVKSCKTINDNCYLVTYQDSIDKEICSKAGIDYIKVLQNELNTKSKNKVNVSISTANAVLAYSRIYMAKVMLDVLNRGGIILYSDTDSVITDIELSPELVDNKNLGKFKLEHEIIEGYFVGDKTYAFISKKLNSNGNNIIIKKARTVKAEYLTYDDYKYMYKNARFERGTKISSVKNYKEGSISIIKQDNVHLDLAYTRREILLDNNNNWISTSPSKKPKGQGPLITK